MFVNKTLNQCGFSRENVSILIFTAELENEARIPKSEKAKA